MKSCIVCIQLLYHKIKQKLLHKSIIKVLCFERSIVQRDYIELYQINLDICTNEIVNVSLGEKISQATNPSSYFESYFHESNSINIFTDGSKNPIYPSVGSSCYCPSLQIEKVESINKLASIFQQKLLQSQWL